MLYKFPPSQFLTSQATHLWLADDLFLTLSPPNSFPTIKITININPILTFIHRHMNCALEMIRMWEKHVKVRSGYVFVVLGAWHGRVLTPINGCQSNTNYAWFVNDVCFGKRGLFLDGYVKQPLCSHQPIGHSPICEESFAYGWLEIWGNLHAPVARWLASCLWFAHLT